MNDIVATQGSEVANMSGDSSTLAALQSAEINQQITTARAYPRSIKVFRHKATELATLDEETAAECMYSLPRDGKRIVGPSARLAEIIASSWGNCRYGARIVDEQSDFVVAQGVFHDLENNNAVSFEVKRRIVDKYGKRYSPDMIATTSNAACSIALRNAVFKGVPKALWSSIFEAAKRTALGDEKSLAVRRSTAIDWFGKAGVEKEKIFHHLEVADESEITLDMLAVLQGIRTAVKDGDASIDTVFNAAPRDQKRTMNLKTGEIIEDAEIIDDEIPEEKPKPKAKKAAAKKKPANKPAADKEIQAWPELMATAVSAEAWAAIFANNANVLKGDERAAMLDERSVLANVASKQSPAAMDIISDVLNEPT